MKITENTVELSFAEYQDIESLAALALACAMETNVVDRNDRPVTGEQVREQISLQVENFIKRFPRFDPETGEYKARPWAVGELVRDSGGQKLCVNEEEGFLTWIGEDGYTYDGAAIAQRKAVFSHNTGLEYPYQDQGAAIEDFKTGFFKPYFEVL